MARVLLVLLALTPTVLVAADERATWLEARKALEAAYFDELEADVRDRHFEALAAWDNPEVVKPVAEIISRFGAYIAQVEGEMALLQGKLDLYKGRPALTDQEIGLRNGYIRRIEAAEARWRRARSSETLLVKVVGGFRDPKTIQTALSVMEKHPSTSVRCVLARACSHWHEHLKDERLSKKAFAALKRLRVDKETEVRVAVARSLGAFKRPEALELLTLCMKDGDWRVRAAAVKSLHASGSAEAVTVLIEAMKSEKGRLKDDINLALQSLTGESLVFAESWAAWWNGVGRQLPKRKKPAGAQSDELKAKDTARFYGIPTRSQHICFIIDVSGSMKKEVEQIRRVVITGRPEREMPVEGKTRIEVAKNELKRAVGNLSPDKLFSIIFFNQAVNLWRKEMTKATREVKEQLRKELAAVGPSGTTYTLGALREAFVMAGVLTASGTKQKVAELGVDTIFLLSDGGPTDNKLEDPKPMDPEIILESVREWNRDAGIVIHAIAVDCDPAGTYFLKQIAAQNGGVFVERKK